MILGGGPFNTSMFPPAPTFTAKPMVLTDQTTMMSAGQVRRRRKTRLDKAIYATPTGKRSEVEGVSFYATDADTLVAGMGSLKPIYAGRPQAWMTLFLNTIPSPHRPPAALASFAYQAVQRGVLYTLPYIPGRRKTSFRLTAAGLGLLDYWAEKNKRFALFYNAYVTKAARDQINSDCFDFAVNIMPARIARDVEVQRTMVDKLKQEASKREQEKMQRLLYEQQANQWYFEAMQRSQGQSTLGMQHTPWLGSSPSLLLGGSPTTATGTAAPKQVNRLASLLSKVTPW